MSNRKAMFEQAVEVTDERAITKSIDFREHRYVSIERDPVTDMRYAQGHATLRGACDHLARATASESLMPELVLDLDSGERHELDVLAFVAPKQMDAIAVMMPRHVAEAVVACLQPYVCDCGRDVPLLDACAPAVKLITQALTRKTGA